MKLPIVLCTVAFTVAERRRCQQAKLSRSSSGQIGRITELKRRAQNTCHSLRHSVSMSDLTATHTSTPSSTEKGGSASSALPPSASASYTGPSMRSAAADGSASGEGRRVRRQVAMLCQYMSFCMVSLADGAIYLSLTCRGD